MTIDNLNNSITIKFDELKNIINIYLIKIKDDNHQQQLSNIYNELEELITAFDFGTIEFLNKNSALNNLEDINGTEKLKIYDTINL
jgi:hypothetical protein